MRPPLNRTSITIRVGCRATIASNAGQDDDARRPNRRRDAEGVEGTVRVQWVERARRRESSGLTGDEPATDVYFLIGLADRTTLETATAQTLAIGDVINAKAGTALLPRLYITEIRQTAHQQTHGGGTLWQCFLGVRSPE